MLIPDPGGTLSDRFQMISQIGVGGYSRVFKAKDLRTRDIRALKEIRCRSPTLGLPLSFYRERASLSELSHPNIVSYFGVVSSTTPSGDPEYLYLILEYCPYELSALINFRGYPGMPVVQARCYMRQLLSALSMMHLNGFVHRDIKPANIFVTRDNVVKLGDFGLARNLDRKSNRLLSNEVITPAYRSPEVLLKDGNYGFPVDIWSLGCVFFEMATGKMLFTPRTATDAAQLVTIFAICGTPTVDDWPGLVDLPEYDAVRHFRVIPSTLTERLDRNLPTEYELLKDLITSMLILDPLQRITAEEALRHPFFDGVAEPDNLPLLSLPESQMTRDIKSGSHFLRQERVLPPIVSVCRPSRGDFVPPSDRLLFLDFVS
jgi:serine/threonine protein kinase